MSLIDRRLGLSFETDDQGLIVSPTAVSLAGAPLLMTTPSGLAPRPFAEIERLAKAAYGDAVDPVRMRSTLSVVAEALNRDDIGRAMVAMLHLRLPALSKAAALSLAKVEEAFARYSPDQPRDWRGRWTDGDGDGSGSRRTAIPSARTSAVPASPSSAPPDLPLQQATTPPLQGARRTPFQGLWSRPRLYQGNDGPPEDEPPPIGHNGPPGDPLEVEREPDAQVEAVPHGWDVPGQTLNGLYYPPRRYPVLPDGTPWPVVTVAAVRRILGGKASFLKIFVPDDGEGPMLIGSTPDREMMSPKGYSVVEFRGKPQANFAGDRETDQADKCVEEAMRLARTNQFSMIFFNSTVSTGTGRLVESLLRPDVYGVFRPKLNFTPPARWHASEIKSPRQKDDYRTEGELKMMGVKDVTYKIIRGGALSKQGQ